MKPPLDDPEEMFAASLTRRAAPAAPDAALLERLRAAKPAPASRTGRTVWKWIAVPLSAAAAWAILFLRAAPVAVSPADVVADAAAPPPPVANYYPPVASSQELLAVRDLGVVRDSLQRPVRLVSASWLDEEAFGKPGEKPALRESQFRHEIVPVLLPVY